MNNQVVHFDHLMDIIQEKIDVGSEVTIISTGISMEPLFRHKQDEVTLIQSDTYKKYDMILYRRNSGQYVLHRIVGCREDGFILRGDNQFINEYGIKQSQIIAKVVKFKRNGKEYSCHHLGYKLYVLVWVHSCLFRRCFRKLKTLLLRK